MIFTRVARRPTHNNGCGPLPVKAAHPWSSKWETNVIFKNSTLPVFRLTITAVTMVVEHTELLTDTNCQLKTHLLIDCNMASMQNTPAFSCIEKRARIMIADPYLSSSFTYYALWPVPYHNLFWNQQFVFDFGDNSFDGTISRPLRAREIHKVIKERSATMHRGAGLPISFSLSYLCVHRPQCQHVI